MRDDEEIKFEKDQKIDIVKSAISKHIGFRVLIGLKLTERKRNTEIQTYNVDFLIDQNKTKQAFEDAKKEKIFRANTQGVGTDSIDDPLYDAFQDPESMAKAEG